LLGGEIVILELMAEVQSKLTSTQTQAIYEMQTIEGRGVCATLYDIWHTGNKRW